MKMFHRLVQDAKFRARDRDDAMVVLQIEFGFGQQKMIDRVGLGENAGDLMTPSRFDPQRFLPQGDSGLLAVGSEYPPRYNCPPLQSPLQSSVRNFNSPPAARGG